MKKIFKLGLYCALLPKLISIVLDGIHEKFNDTEYVYQIPELSPPVGVVLLAHGCSHSSTDFWPKSVTCPDCIGLPVERKLVEISLELNMAVLAISSNDRESKCWTNKDRMSVLSKFIRHFYRTKLNTLSSPDSIPLYLFGASSGGMYVGVLSQQAAALNLPVGGTIVQISPPFRFQSASNLRPYAFIHMVRDKYIAQYTQGLIRDIKQAGAQTLEIRVSPKLLLPDYFTFNGILSSADSAKLVKDLKAAGYLSEDNHLIADPRQSDWRTVGYLSFLFCPYLNNRLPLLLSFYCPLIVLCLNLLGWFKLFITFASAGGKLQSAARGAGSGLARGGPKRHQRTHERRLGESRDYR